MLDMTAPCASQRSGFAEPKDSRSGRWRKRIRDRWMVGKQGLLVCLARAVSSSRLAWCRQSSRHDTRGGQFSSRGPADTRTSSQLAPGLFPAVGLHYTEANGCVCPGANPPARIALQKLTLPVVRWWGGDSPQLGCGSGNFTPGNVIRPLAQVRGRGGSRDGAGSANPRDRRSTPGSPAYCVFSRATVANAITERHAASSRIEFGPSGPLSSRDGMAPVPARLQTAM